MRGRVLFWVAFGSAMCGCGGGAFTSGSSDPTSPKPSESQAFADDGGAPANVQATRTAAGGDAAALPERDADAPDAAHAADAHTGPWLPIIDPSTADAVAPGTYCVGNFTLAPPGAPASVACALFSPLSHTKGGGDNLCAEGASNASQYCLGISDKQGDQCVHDNCPAFQFDPAGHALCVFRCYDAAICGEASAAALEKCDGTSDPVCGTATGAQLDAGGCANVTKDPLGCLIRYSCYPSYDAPYPW